MRNIFVLWILVGFVSNIAFSAPIGGSIRYFADLLRTCLKNTCVLSF